MARRQEVALRHFWTEQVSLWVKAGAYYVVQSCCSAEQRNVGQRPCHPVV